MAYSQFTLQKVLRDFNLTLMEQGDFLNPQATVSPSGYLAEFIDRNLPLAIAQSTEKSRSELVISPTLLAAKEALNNRVSLFSGEDFSVDPEAGLSGVCDFIFSQSPEQSIIQAPVAVVVEAKKDDLRGGLGQCLAEMVAAQKFNQANQKPIFTIYGAVTTGTIWRFLRLEASTVTLDLHEYPLPPIEPILSRLVTMLEPALPL
ncbi:MAG: hypothetical protein ACKO24_06565 [Leptolyngbyaceae cyanobacterium]